MPDPYLQPPEFLYHATRRSNLDSILGSGLLRANHGAVHGAMEYRPPEDAVYLSINENSSNLHGSLFSSSDPHDEVIVLRIRTADIDIARLYPDDAFFYRLDEEFCAEAEDFAGDSKELRAYVAEMSPQFGELFGLDSKEAYKYLQAFCLSDGSHDAYSEIATKMGGLRYLNRQGEAAYLGNVPPSAIVGWDTHPNSSSQAKRARPPRYF